MLLTLLCLLVSGSLYRVSDAKSSEAKSSSWATKGRETGFPVPRFVSLRAEKARMRVGPAFEYAVEWLYQAPGLPLEIIEEYGNWRQVRDCDGVTGWMHHSLLSSKRTALVGPWLTRMASLMARPRKDGLIKAKLGPRVRVQVSSCSLVYCYVITTRSGIAGYMEKSDLWGVYPQEEIY